LTGGWLVKCRWKMTRWTTISCRRPARSDT